jgi:hypothetical protein
MLVVAKNGDTHSAGKTIFKEGGEKDEKTLTRMGLTNQFSEPSAQKFMLRHRETQQFSFRGNECMSAS